MFSIFIDIFRQIKNVILTFSISLAVFFVLRALPSWYIIRDFFKLPNITALRRLEVVWDYSIGNFGRLGWVDTVVSLLLAILLGINIVIFIHYVRFYKKAFSGRGAMLSFSGMILGVFGVGCLACGALALAPLLALLGVTGFVHFGSDIALLGLVMVAGSSIFLLYKMNKPVVCIPKELV